MSAGRECVLDFHGGRECAAIEFLRNAKPATMPGVCVPKEGDTLPRTVFTSKSYDDCGRTFVEMALYDANGEAVLLKVYSNGITHKRNHTTAKCFMRALGLPTSVPIPDKPQKKEFAHIAQTLLGEHDIRNHAGDEDKSVYRYEFDCGDIGGTVEVTKKSWKVSALRHNWSETPGCSGWVTTWYMEGKVNSTDVVAELDEYSSALDTLHQYLNNR